MAPQRIDIMSPGNEPTDEELALVMREARDEAERRRELAQQWLHRAIREAVKVSLETRRARLAKRPLLST
jgi:hypothetical protein